MLLMDKILMTLGMLYSLHGSGARAMQDFCPSIAVAILAAHSYLFLIPSLYTPNPRQLHVADSLSLVPLSGTPPWFPNGTHRLRTSGFRYGLKV